MSARAVMGLVHAFDIARSSFVAKNVRSAEFDANLRAALDEARELGDVGGVFMPLSVWVGAQCFARAWLEGSDEFRRGRAGHAANEAIAALLACQTGRTDEPYPPPPPRAQQVLDAMRRTPADATHRPALSPQQLAAGEGRERADD